MRARTRCPPPQDGRAKLLEHNVRFGDPECQTLMARTEGDLTEALLQVRAHPRGHAGT